MNFWIIRDANGWPVEFFKGQPIKNAMRFLFLCDLAQTYVKRKKPPVLDRITKSDGTIKDSLTVQSSKA